MRSRVLAGATFTVAMVSLILGVQTWPGLARGDDQPPSSYTPVVDKRSFEATLKKMSEGKAGVMAKQRKLLEERYDLSNKPSSDAKMDRSKPIQEGVRTKLPEGVSWEALSNMTAAEIKQKKAWPMQEGLLKMHLKVALEAGH